MKLDDDVVMIDAEPVSDVPAETRTGSGVAPAKRPDLRSGTDGATPDPFRHAPRTSAEASRTSVEASRRSADAHGRSATAALAKQLGLDFLADPSGRPADKAFVARVPIAFARKHSMLAVGWAPAHHPAGPRHAVRPDSDGGPGPTLLVMGNPRDVEALQIVARFLGRPVTPVLAEPAAVNAAIDAAYGGQTGQAQALVDRLPTIERPEREDVLAAVRDLSGGGREDLLDVASRAPTIQLVNLILFEAVQARASDVHVQPTEHDLAVRMRIDGVLYDLFTLPKNIQEEVVSRLKVMGRMNIAEKRLPQDGRAGVQIGERTIDLRIASLPTSFGERVVVRLLDKDKRLLDLADLGMGGGELSRFRRLVNAEHGIVLVTGPTGSGKTTTLYAARCARSTARNGTSLPSKIRSNTSSKASARRR